MVNYMCNRNNKSEVHMIRDCVASRALERFGMSEDEYLRNRIAQGYSARAIARELGFSPVAVAKRMHRLAKPQKWVVMEEVAV